MSLKKPKYGPYGFFVARRTSIYAASVHRFFVRSLHGRIEECPSKQTRQKSKARQTRQVNKARRARQAREAKKAKIKPSKLLPPPEMGLKLEEKVKLNSEKITKISLFKDKFGKMNRSLTDVNGSICTSDLLDV